MAKVKLNLDKMNIDDKISFSKRLTNNLRNNPYFFDKNLNIKSFSNFLQQIEDALPLLTTDPSVLVDVMEMELELDAKLQYLVYQIQKVSRGNSVIISSTGLDWESPNKDINDLCGFEVEMRKREGEADIHWKRVYGAKAYLIEISTNPNNPSSWKKIGHSIRSQYTCFNLKKGQPYYIRVSVLNEDSSVISRKVQILYAA